jgi:hypothetical protein
MEMPSQSHDELGPITGISELRPKIDADLDRANDRQGLKVEFLVEHPADRVNLAKVRLLEPDLENVRNPPRPLVDDINIAPASNHMFDDLLNPLVLGRFAKNEPDRDPIDHSAAFEFIQLHLGHKRIPTFEAPLLFVDRHPDVSQVA